MNSARIARTTESAVYALPANVLVPLRETTENLPSLGPHCPTKPAVAASYDLNFGQYVRLMCPNSHMDFPNADTCPVMAPLGILISDLLSIDF